jgi:superfamily II DNA or RNA helicase
MEVADTFCLEAEPRRSDSLSFNLRPYQQQAVDAVVDMLRTHDSCLLTQATGTGKTETAIATVDAMDARDGAIICGPFIDLVGQTAARFRSRGIPCGVEQGVLKSSEPVTSACYASLLSRRRYEQYLGRTKLLIVDESHLNYTPAALKMLGYFREAGTKILGMTASPQRASGDPLTQWYGPVAFDYPYQRAVEDGYLAPTKLWTVVLEDLDLSAFKGRFGDFDQEKMDALLRSEQNVQTVASLIEQHHEGQPSVVFCQSIKHAEMLREVLARRDIFASIVHSKMDPLERRQHQRDFESGENNVILNVGCLTTGWDFPPLAKLFIARPTKSKSLYIQMFGRGTRTLKGVIDGLHTPEDRRAAIAASAKPFAEVFDFTDTSRHCDLRTAVDVLAPELEGELLTRVKRACEGRSQAIALDPVIEEQRAAMAREEAARHALEVEQRKLLTANGQFRLYERDVYAKAEVQARPRNTWFIENHMIFGKHKGQKIRDTPTGYLRWVLRESNCRNQIHMAAIRREVARRDIAEQRSR